ncbi:MAG: methyltransferase domain-containing protein [Alphaproteobacteria bacterium]|nr:methyltransferase domain-containing protein [Alphaproteobacteria bacterium]
MSDASLFFSLWLQKPLQIGAVYPSGLPLADMMARQVGLHRPGAVLELGAGTGGLTRGLLRAGCPPERVVALEREPRLAAVLRRDFPGVRTIAADARDIESHLARLEITLLCGVISGIPIKWFSIEDQRAVLEPCLRRLAPGGRFLQLTNAFSSPIAAARIGVFGRPVARVWWNLPPAQIWAYSAQTDISAEAA